MTVSNETLSPPEAIGRVLGVRSKSMPQLRHYVDEGLPVFVVERMAKRLALQQKQMWRLLHLSRATWHRRKQQGRLSRDESDRLYRVAKVLARAEALFEGSREQAQAWLHRPAPALEGRAPWELLDSEVGTDQVLTLIEQLEHGVYI